MIEEPFALGDSWIHGLDPRLRVVAAAAFSLVVALAINPWVIALALGAALILAGLARLPWGRLLRRLALAGLFLLFIGLFLPFAQPGDPLFHLGPLTASRQGTFLALVMITKALTILLTLTALLATMGIGALGHALHRLGMPAKLVYLLLVTYRYLFVMEQEYQRLRRAAQIRGFTPRTNLHTYRTYAYLIGMLLVRAAARAERVHQAMCCRGFCGRFYSLSDYPARRSNRIFAALMGLLILGLALGQWWPQ
ncbi:MAG: cobalt ECF transporter T component CbiQ [Desulfobacterales bacterium]